MKDREIILEADGHYWISFKHGFMKDVVSMGKYDKENDMFQLIGETMLFEANQFDIVSDIILRQTEFKKF